MGKQNAFMLEQARLRQGMLEVGLDTGFQKCWDLVQIALRDPEVVGKDIFGRKRLEKLYRGLQKYEKNVAVSVGDGCRFRCHAKGSRLFIA